MMLNARVLTQPHHQGTTTDERILMITHEKRNAHKSINFTIHPNPSIDRIPGQQTVKPATELVKLCLVTSNEDSDFTRCFAWLQIAIHFQFPFIHRSIDQEETQECVFSRI